MSNYTRLEAGGGGVWGWGGGASTAKDLKCKLLNWWSVEKMKQWRGRNWRKRRTARKEGQVGRRF